MQITTIGLDIAKNVFQVHGIDAAEKVVIRKQLRRGQVLKFFASLPPCLVGLEACASAHYWARELTKLGHEVRLMPSQDGKAYAKRKKNRRENVICVPHRANGESKGVESVPGIGPIGASAITATVTDPSAFRSGRDFAAWVGLVPRQDSTGGKQKLGPISKQGDRYLRRILVVGAHSVLRRAKKNPEKYPWLTQLLARRPFKVVAIALANKMARVAWALLARGGTYRVPALAAA